MAQTGREPCGTTTVVSWRGGGGLLLLKEKQPANASGNSRISQDKRMVKLRCRKRERSAASGCEEMGGPARESIRVACTYSCSAEAFGKT